MGQVVHASTDHIVVASVIVPDLNFKDGVAVEWDSEHHGVIPVRILAGVLSSGGALILPSQVDLAVGALHRQISTIKPKVSVS